MLRETSYADLTVRAVAKRANVAPATAYTYFSSKNHLVAEVYPHCLGGCHQIGTGISPSG